MATRFESLPAVFSALSDPTRFAVVERLMAGPASVSDLAAPFPMAGPSFLKHLRVLEDAGLVQLVEERPRRGFVERVLMATADTFVVDPEVIHAGPPPADAQDRFAADHLVQVAAGVARDVARMRVAADAQRKRLLTLTVEAELGFARPADFDAFAEELSAAAAALARKYASAPHARRYRLVVAAHPAPRPPSSEGAAA